MKYIVWRTTSVAGDRPRFLTAATHFPVLDVDTLEPNWGTLVEGVRAGLSVDRPIFKEGEMIPLHLRWEDVSAPAPLAQGECLEPWPVLEIQNAQHEVLRTVPMDFFCSGHGFGPGAMPKGKPQRLLRQIVSAPLMPDPFARSLPVGVLDPGVYYLVTVWSPHVLEKRESSPLPMSRGGFGKVYAVARSLPVRIEIVPTSRKSFCYDL
jgi:hypothetical protein